MESHCLFRVGLSSLIKSISKIRQSNLFWHFLEILKQRSMSTAATLCCSLRWLPFVGPLCSSIRWWSYTENYTQRQPSQRAAQYGPRWYHASIVFCCVNLNSKMYKYIKTALQKEWIPDPLHQYPHPGWNMLSHEPDPVLAQLTPPQQDEHSGRNKIKDYGNHNRDNVCIAWS